MRLRKGHTNGCQLSGDLRHFIHQRLKELLMITEKLSLIAYGILNPVEICWVHFGQIVLSRFTKLADPKADTTIRKVQGSLIKQKGEQ